MVSSDWWMRNGAGTERRSCSSWSGQNYTEAIWGSWADVSLMTLTYTSHSACRSILPQHRESNGNKLTLRSGHGVKRLQSRPTQLVRKRCSSHPGGFPASDPAHLQIRFVSSCIRSLMLAESVNVPKPFQDKIVACTIHEAMWCSQKCSGFASIV